MTGVRRATGGRQTDVAAVLLFWAVLVLAPNLAVFGVRTTSAVTSGSFDETTGTERVPLYGVWKASHGYPVYERPFADNFYPALYNFAFYHTYGAVSRAFGWTDGTIATSSRLLTVVLTLVGAGLSVLWLRQLSPPDDVTLRSRLWVPLAVLATWLSSAGVSWFYVTVRPDIISLVFALAGVCVYTAARQKRHIAGLLAASLLFYAAWACKQSTVGLLGGVVLHALSGRRLRDAVTVAVPFVLLVAVTLVAGGVPYRLNVLTLPSFAHFLLDSHIVTNILRVFGPNPWVWLVPVLAFGAIRPALTFVDERVSSPGADHWPMRLLVSCAFASWAICLLALTRDGGYRNSLLEAYVVTALLAIYVAPSACAGALRSRTRAFLLGAACLLTAGFPVAQLALPNRLGTVTVSSAPRLAQGVAIEACLRNAPKPLFSEDYLFAEPWFSTNNRYPATVLDNYLFLPARSAGRVTGGGIDGLIERRHFGSLLLTGVLNLDETARRAGYVQARLPPHPDWDVRLYVPMGTSNPCPD